MSITINLVYRKLIRKVKRELKQFTRGKKSFIETHNKLIQLGYNLVKISDVEYKLIDY